MNQHEVRGRVRDAGGAALLERLDHLDGLLARQPPLCPATAPPVPDGGTTADFDVALAGGGLWSILAPVLQSAGLKVVVIDRARAGAAHREWNASARELDALVAVGLLTDAELRALIVARYREGFCRFHGGGTYPIAGVLDHAVDAGGLLALARAKAEAQGVAFLDGHTVVSHASGPDAIAVRLQSGGSERDLVARVMVDARGAASPYATADLVCPTVGGVLTGLAQGDALDEVNPEVGEILVTNEPIRDGRQHVWEAFPGRPGETTVYLFHYAHADVAGRSGRISLTGLFARFFASVGTYKRGEAKLVRPTFGLIPGWSRLSRAPAAPPGRVVLVGDAAARHSPLTYCGFGAALRSLSPAARAIGRLATEPGAGARGCIVDDAPVHALTGALSRILASDAFAGNELNELLDAALRTLHESGPELYARLLRDQMDAPDFARFLGRTARRHPQVWRKVIRGMGPGAAARWGFGLARALVRSA